MFAYILQTAIRTSGPPCHADRPPMQNEAVAQIIPLLRGHDLPKLPLYFGRFLNAVHKADQIAQTDAVSIRDNGRLAEYIAHDQIGTLSAHARKSQQLLEGFRDTVIILFVQNLHAGGDIPRLAGAQPAGPHDLLDLLRLRFCQRRDRRELFI